MDEEHVPGPLEEWIKAQPFVFAKTMPENPHHYIVERKHAGTELTAFVEHVQTHGNVRRYEGYPYQYVEIGEFTYWLTRAEDAGWIINRKLTTEAGWDE